MFAPEERESLAELHAAARQVKRVAAGVSWSSFEEWKSLPRDERLARTAEHRALAEEYVALVKQIEEIHRAAESRQRTAGEGIV
jgi:hypothetical protein